MMGGGRLCRFYFSPTSSTLEKKACAARITALQSSVRAFAGVASTQPATDNNPVAEKIIHNRKLRSSVAQRRHLHARLSAIFGSGRGNEGHRDIRSTVTPDRPSLENNALVSFVTQSVTSSTAATSSRVQLRVHERCCVLTPVVTGTTREVAEERAALKALHLFPSSSAWSHFYKALDSRVFRDVMELSQLADIDNVEIQLVATDTSVHDRTLAKASFSRSPSDRHDARQRFVVTVVGRKRPVEHMEEHRGEDRPGEHLVAVARESANQPRDAVKLALAAAVKKLDAWANDEWGAVATDTEILLREREQARSHSPLGPGWALRQYLGGQPSIPFVVTPAWRSGKWPDKVHLFCDDARNKQRAVVRAVLSDPTDCRHGVPRLLGKTVLPPLQRRVMYVPHFLHKTDTLKLSRDPKRKLQSEEAVARALGAISMMKRNAFHCTPSISLQGCFEVLMRSEVVQLRLQDLRGVAYTKSAVPGKGLVDAFFTVFEPELKSLWRPLNGLEADQQSTTNTHRLLSSVTPHLCRRSSSTLTMAREAPLNLLQEGFFTMAYVAMAAAAQDDVTITATQGIIPGLGVFSAHSFLQQQNGMSGILQYLTNAAAMSLLSLPASVVMPKEASPAFVVDTRWTLAEFTRFTKECFQHEGWVRWKSRDPHHTQHQFGADGLVKEVELTLSWRTQASGDDGAGAFLTRLANRGAPKRDETVREKRTLVLGSALEVSETDRFAKGSRPVGPLLQKRLSLLHRVGLPAQSHPLVQQYEPRWLRTANANDVAPAQSMPDALTLMKQEGKLVGEVVQRHRATQNEILVPDVPLLITQMREKLCLPQDSFPAIQFFQEARHEPARRVNQLNRGRPGDVNFLTRVVVKWGASRHGSAEPLVAIAESDPDAHPTDADGLPMTSSPFSLDSQTFSFGLRDIGEPRGPLVLLISAICELYGKVMEHESHGSLPLINVREGEAASDGWHMKRPGRGGLRRALDFLLYSWFGGVPQVRCYDITTYTNNSDTARDNVSGWSWKGSSKVGNEWIQSRVTAPSTAVRERSPAVHMVRAMLLYDILGQRVLFAETHDFTVEAAVSRVNELAYRLNMPRLEFNVRDSGVHLTGGGRGEPTAPKSAVSIRPFRSLSSVSRHERVLNSLRTLLPRAVEEAKQQTTESIHQKVQRDVCKQLSSHESELVALLNLAEAVVSTTAASTPTSSLEDAAGAVDRSEATRAKRRLRLVLRYEPNVTQSAAVQEGESSMLHGDGDSGAWWGRCVSGLAVPAVRGILEMRLVVEDAVSASTESALQPVDAPHSMTQRAETLSSRREAVGTASGETGVLPALRKLCRDTIASVLTRNGAPLSLIELLLNACEDAGPLLQRRGDGFPAYDPRFYYPPQLLGTLLQGVAGRYECHYERVPLGSTDWKSDIKSPSSRAAIDEEINGPSLVFYSSAASAPKKSSPWENSSPGAREAVANVEASGNVPHKSTRPPSVVLATKCTIFVASLGGYLNHSVAQQATMGGGVGGSPSSHGAFPLGVGYGRTKREAWLSAAWHALRHNFPSVVTQLGSFQEMCEIHRDPMALAALSNCPFGGAELHLPTLRWRWRRRHPNGTARIECDVTASPPHGTPCEEKGAEGRVALARGSGETHALAYTDAAAQLDRLVREKKASADKASPLPFTSWDVRAHYQKSLWHALCTAVATAHGPGSTAHVLFVQEHTRDVKELNPFGAVAGLAMLLSIKHTRPSDGVKVSGTVKRVPWEEILLAGGLGTVGVATPRGLRKDEARRLAAQLSQETDVSTAGAMFLLGVTRSLQQTVAEMTQAAPSKTTQDPSTQTQSLPFTGQTTTELNALLSLITREAITPELSLGNRHSRRPVRNSGPQPWRSSLLQRCVRSLSAVTGLQVQSVLRRSDSDGVPTKNSSSEGVWTAELLLYVPMFMGASEGNPRANRERLPLVVCRGSGATQAEAETEVSRMVSGFLKHVVDLVQ